MPSKIPDVKGNCVIRIFLCRNLNRSSSTSSISSLISSSNGISGRLGNSRSWPPYSSVIWLLGSLRALFCVSIFQKYKWFGDNESLLFCYSGKHTSQISVFVQEQPVLTVQLKMISHFKPPACCIFSVKYAHINHLPNLHFPLKISEFWTWYPRLRRRCSFFPLIP